ncbi:MAG: B12-binding domain-containing radical SAM protein [Elusimicrobia bacterium]|nr:B12-binding domain-containing radical SAM protein [Elusimicrobiota bacterium]
MKCLLMTPVQRKGFVLGVSKFAYSMKRMPPLGLLYVSASLEQIGCNTDIIDLRHTYYNDDELIRIIKEKKYDVVGMYTDTSLKDTVIHYTGLIKKSTNLPVMIGGPGTLHPEEYLKGGADYVVFGEGEITAKEIIENLQGKLDIGSIKGIGFLRDGKMAVNPKRELIENIDTLPFPDYKKIDISGYHDFFFINMRKPYATMMTSRGCPFRCAYCTSHVIWTRKVRQMSVERVMKEIDFLVKEYNIKLIDFLDDIFGLKKDWIYDFCNELIKRKYDLKWCVILHPWSFKGYREDIFKLMKKAGCVTTKLGIQSANPKILKNVNRNPEDLEGAKDIIRLSKKHGMFIVTEMIFGLPEDTRATVNENLDFAFKTNPHYALFFEYQHLEGSELFLRYPNRDFTEIPNDEVKQLVKKANEKFYLRLSKIFELFIYALTHRPMWIFQVLKNSRFVLNLIGLRKGQ